jgi:hypothetical protein
MGYSDATGSVYIVFLGGGWVIARDYLEGLVYMGEQLNGSQRNKFCGICMNFSGLS